MGTHKGEITFLCKALFTLSAFLFFSSVYALAPGSRVEVPGSIEPGRFNDRIEAPLNRKSIPQVAAAHPEKKAENKLGPEAKKIKFFLTRIILEDNKVFSDEELQKLYQDKLHTNISVADLQEIVESISNFYRNQGYILTHAVLPQQHVKNGVVRIRVLEGYVKNVSVIGNARGAREIVQRYGNNIKDSKPLQVSVMERNLLIANEVPGVRTKAVIEPSKTPGASDVELATDTQTASGFISYDNYGTRYVGPQQITAGVQGNSLFRSGDKTQIIYATTSKGNELQYKSIQHETPIGNNGMRLSVDGNRSTTNPLYLLKDIQFAGLANNYNGNISYPVIRSRSQNLTVEGGFSYLDSFTTQFDVPLYDDHIRSVHVGASYDFADRFHGANLLNLTLKQGINVLGATTANNVSNTSRYGATGIFTKVNAQVSRQQAIKGPVSAFALIKGQYTFNPLLSSEQFGFGGAQLGRGYDPAEIIGDRGAGGTVELRVDTAPGNQIIQAAQFYVFYDAGVTWNMRNVIQNVSTKLTATSTGVGMRIYMLKYLTGNITYAQPLTRQVQSLEFIGNGKSPRLLFSLTATD